MYLSPITHYYPFTFKLKEKGKLNLWVGNFCFNYAGQDLLCGSFNALQKWGLSLTQETPVRRCVYLAFVSGGSKFISHWMLALWHLSNMFPNTPTQQQEFYSYVMPASLAGGKVLPSSRHQYKVKSQTAHGERRDVPKSTTVSVRCPHHWVMCSSEIVSWVYRDFENSPRNKIYLIVENINWETSQGQTTGK